MSFDRLYSFNELMSMIFADDVIIVLPESPNNRVADHSSLPPATRRANAGLVQIMIAEMEIVREAFIGFQDEIGNYAIAPFLAIALEDFASECIALCHIIGKGNDGASYDDLLTCRMLDLAGNELEMRKKIYQAFIKKYLSSDNTMPFRDDPLN